MSSNPFDQFRLLEDPPPSADPQGQDDDYDWDNDPIIRYARTLRGEIPAPTASAELIPTPEQPQQPPAGQDDRGFFSSLLDIAPSDYGKAIAGGAFNMARSLGALQGQAVAPGAGLSDEQNQRLYELQERNLSPEGRRAADVEIQRVGQSIYDSMSPEAQEARTRSVVERRQEPVKPTGMAGVNPLTSLFDFVRGRYQTGDANAATIALTTAESAPSIVGGIVGGAGAANVLRGGVQQLSGRVAMSTQAVERLNKLAAAVGYGLGEGTIAAASQKQQIQDEVRALPPEVLANSGRFQEIWLAAQDLPPDERFEYARDALAMDLGNGAAFQTFVATLSTGPLGASLVGRVAGKMRGGAAAVPDAQVGRLATIGKDAMGEASQEFVQSGAEGLISARTLQEAGVETDPEIEALNAATLGAASGGALGAGVSALSTRGQPLIAPPQPAAPPGGPWGAPAPPPAARPAEAAATPDAAAAPPQEAAAPPSRDPGAAGAKVTGKQLMDLLQTAKAAGIPPEQITPIAQGVLRAGRGKTGDLVRAEAADQLRGMIADAQARAAPPAAPPTEPAGAAAAVSSQAEAPAQPTTTEEGSPTTASMPEPAAPEGPPAAPSEQLPRAETVIQALPEPAKPEAPQAEPKSPGERLTASVKADPDGALRAYASVPGTDGGRVLAPDLAKQISPEYNADRTLSDSMGPGAGWLMQEAYNRRLREAPAEGQDNVVVFTSGGTGAGKSTAVDVDPTVSRAQIVYDTNLANFDVAKRRIDAALAAGKDVRISHVYREPGEAYENGVLPRARADMEGRPVTFENHARMHARSNEVIRQLAAAYADDTRVQIRVVDNSGGPGAAKLIDVADLPAVEYNAARDAAQAALEAQYDAGAVDDRIYRASGGQRTERAPRLGPVDRGQPEQSRAGEAEAPAEVAGEQQPQGRDPKTFLRASEYTEVARRTLPSKKNPNTAIPDAEVTVVQAADGTYAVGYSYQTNSTDGTASPPWGVYQTTDEAMQAGEQAIRAGLERAGDSASNRGRIESWLQRQPATDPPAPARKPDKARIVPTRGKDGGVEIRAEPVSESGPARNFGPTWDRSTRAQRLEILRSASYTNSATDDLLADLPWNQLTDLHRKVISARNGIATAPAAPPVQDGAQGAAPQVSANTVFTDDAAAAARERLRKKLGQVRSGIDPEMMQDGITLAGYHIEKGARTFAAYAKAMIADLGESVRPYLKSWYMGVKYDPRAADFDGMDMAAYVEAVNVDQITVDDAPQADAAPADGGLTAAERKYVQAIADRLAPANLNPLLRSIVEARALYKQIVGGDIMGPAVKRVDELVELAVVEKARFLAAQLKEPAEAYKALVQLYDSQPRLGTRTSTSIANQAYSTPAPLAYLAAQLAGINNTTYVLEPSAGNGMLLMTANPERTHAVELNAERARTLEYFGFKPVVGDAMADSSAPDHSQDVVIANPPFGVVKTDSGASRGFSVDMGGTLGPFTTNEIDRAISLQALGHLKDGGSAVLIIGGVNKQAKSREARSDAYNGAAKRKFFYRLYNNYNVVDHFTVAGELYERQGAGWPVDVIVIRGKGKSGRALPAVDVPRVYDSWAAMEPLLEANRGVVATGGMEPAVGEPGTAADGGVAAPAAETRPGAVPVPAVGSNPVVGRPQPESRPGGAGAAAQPVRSGPTGGRRPGADGGSRVAPADEQPVDMGAAGGSPPAAVDGAGLEDQRAAGSPAGDQPGPARPVEPPAGVADGDRPAAVAPPPTEGRLQVEYQPSSRSEAIGTLVPTNMLTAVQDSLRALEQRVGRVDEYVARELGYAPADVGKYFSAEQIDALALALDQMSRNAGFIIGDQTGIGKGRVVAGVIRYAMRNGMVPMFVTEKPNLYADMYRDLTDIGVKDIRPIMTNSGEKVPLDDEGNVVLKSKSAAQHNAMLQKMADSASLGDDHNVVFTTYSQMQTLKGQFTQRMNFLQALAPNAIIILDESHNAGGNDSARKNSRQKSADGDTQKTGRAAFVRGLIGMGRGVFYSSATYAKRPSVMDLYFKTDMSKAVEGDVKKLPDAIMRGGVPLQQVVSAMLARSGQYIRRERSFDGVEYSATVVPVNRAAAEQISRVMLAVKQFDDSKLDAIKSIKDEIKNEAGAISESGAVGKAGVESTNFTSVMHNVIDQMLVALKVDAAADRAIAALRTGEEKPVITVANTMGSFIEEYVDAAALKPGDTIGLSFRDLLRRYLEKSRTITIKSQTGPARRHYLTDAELGPFALQAYLAVVQAIDDAVDIADVPVSPIDWMHQKLRAAGYKSTEITGRTHAVEYSAGGTQAVYRIRGSKETSIAGRRKAISGFNNGEFDVIILNQAGSTGLSLHASSKFKDRRRRRMVLAQTEKNIDTHMQMLGRVHRTGQVIAPAYDQLIADIPAEKRPAAVTAKKMASLNANTTAARTSQFTSSDVVDFLNQYGDEVVAQLMEEMPEIHLALGEPLDASEGGGYEREDAARRVSGRVPLLPVAQQEQLYELIETGYQEAVQRAEAMGENALEAKTLPLEARVVSTAELFEGSPDARSPFEAGAYALTADVKRLGKPMTSAEVIAAVGARLNAPDVTDIDRLARLGMEATRELVRATNAEYQTYREQQRAQMEAAAVPQMGIEGRMTALDGAQQRWQALMTRLHVGGRYQLELQDGTTLYGVLTDVARKKGVAMPVAAGAWNARFAVADGVRTLTLPLSKIAPSGESAGGTGKVGLQPAAYNSLTRAPIMQMFDDGQSVSRENRVILTGNLLAAYSKVGKGQIINFTMADGSVQQGILMGRNFDLEEFSDAQPVEMTPRAALNLLLAESKAIVKTPDGNLRVQRWGSDFAVITARSKADGGRYFLSEPLRAVVGDFVSTSSSMRAIVASPETALRAMEVITGQLGARLIVTEFKPEALAAGGRNEVKPQQKGGQALYSRGGVSAFYSPTLRALEGAPQNSAYAAQWLGWLRNQPGVKDEELQWMGLKEWLTSQQGAVTREAITDFARANQITVTETLLGPPPASEEESVSDEQMQDRRSELVDQLEEIYGIALDDDISGVSLTETATDEEIEYDDLPPVAQELLDEWQRLGEYLNGDGPDGATITNATRFNNSDLRTPGGSMYRELLLQLPPPRFDESAFKAQRAQMSDQAQIDALNAMAIREREAAARPNYRSPHWDQRDVVAHVRFDERVDTDGNRILFIDELQSDWHQKGRKVGYIESTPPGDTTGWTVKTDENNQYTGQRDIRVYNEKGQMVTMRSGFRGTDAEAIASAEKSFRDVMNFNRVPDAPFKTTWPELSLKRVIRWAAEHGFDGIAWTPGKVQNQRYDLQMALNSLSWKATGNGEQGPTVELDTKRGVTITLMTLPDGEIVGAFETTAGGTIRQTPSFEGKRLSDVIGKELADRISEQPSGRLAGADLTVGGQGMIGFYDKILVAAANKIGKKYSATVKRGRVDAGKFDSDLKERAESHVMLLTPELRDAALAGMPLFKAESGRGSSVAQVRKWLGDTIKALKGAANVEIVQSVDDLRRATGRPDIPADVNGVYFMGDDTVYLVADRLDTAESAKRKLAHEMFGHLAVERHADMQRAIRMVQNLRTMKSRAVLGLWNQVARDQPGLDVNTHAKEVIALMAENGVKNSIVDRLLAWARDTLRKWGIDLEYSETELRALIAAAARALRAEARMSQEDPAGRAADRAYAAGDARALGEALASMKAAQSPMLDSGAAVEQFYQRSPVLSVEGVEGMSVAQIDDALADIMVPMPADRGQPLYSREPDVDPATRESMNRVMAASAHRALPIRDRARLWLHKTFDFSGLAMRQYVVDKFASIAAYERLMNGGELREGATSAYKQTVATQNLGGVMQAVMKGGIPIWRNGAYVPADDGRKGFTEIFAPLVNHPDGNLLPQWEFYAAARRASRLITEQNADGTSREKLFRPEDIERGMALGDQHPEFARVFDDWQAFNSQALDMAQDAGLINAESRALWERNDYVPFYRAVESVSGRMNPVSIKKAIANQRAKVRTLTGSEQALEDVFENILMNVAHLVDASFKNRAAQTIVTQLDGVATRREPKPTEMLRLGVKRVTEALDAAGLMVLPQDLGEDVPVGEPAPSPEYIKYFRKIAPVGPDIVTVMIDGEPQYFRVLDPLLMESLTQIDPNPALRKFDLFGLISGARTLLTRAVTILPGFIVSNFIRDTLSNVVQNQNKSLGDMLKLTFIAEAARGVKDFVADDPVVLELMMSGALSGSVYDTQRGDMKDSLVKLLKDEKNADSYVATVVSPRRMFHVYEKLQQSAENANRLATYRLVRQRGGSHAEAAYQAHDVLNFQQHGSHLAVQFLVMAVPFLNARIQGLDRLARGFHENRMNFVVKGLMLTAATAALVALGADDERYEELEEWDRDINWHFFVGGAHFRIPKPFEVGLLFGTLPERLYRRMAGKDTTRVLGDSVMRALTDTFAFNPMPQLFKPWVEAWANKSSFKQAPILSTQDQNLLPEAQARPWTSPTLISLAEAMPDGAPAMLRSPLMLDHLVRGYTGGLGIGALEIADRLTRATGGYPDAPQQAFHEYALRRFYRTGNPRQTKWVDEVYRMMEVADDTARTVKQYADQNRLEDAQTLMRERGEVLRMRPALNDLQKQIRRLNGQARLVQNSRTMTPEAKREALDRIYGRRNELARQVAPYSPMF
jgi:hypothetical protein